MTDVLLIVGARPNYVKVAPLLHALSDVHGIGVRVLNTGQHYDRALSGSFLELLEFPEPDHDLGVGSGTHAEQTAAVLIGTERLLLQQPPDVVVVPGDVNSTLAAALAAAKLQIPVAHLEAGLRSGDRTMPEELNRVIADHLADLALCSSQDGVENLAAEGIAGAERVALVGNTMIDSLFKLEARAAGQNILERLGVSPGDFVLVTLHRPALVDDPVALAEVITTLGGIGASIPVLFPVHPRTRSRIQAAHLSDLRGVRLLAPLEYLDFLALQREARLVVTDSGGVQEETSVLGVPCLTYRTTTERPITVSHGTNEVVGTDPVALRSAAERIFASPPPRGRPEIPLWDGAAGPRAAAALSNWLSRPRPVDDLLANAAVISGR